MTTGWTPLDKYFQTMWTARIVWQEAVGGGHHGIRSVFRIHWPGMETARGWTVREFVVPGMWHLTIILTE